MKAELIVRAGGEELRFPLEGDELTVGRGAECDIVIADDIVSRFQGRLVRTETGYTFVQVGLTNPTLLGTTVIRRRALADRDVLQIGTGDRRVSLEYRVDLSDALMTHDPTFLGTVALSTGSQTLSVGRSPDNDLVLNDPTVSRHHAELVCDGDDATLSDLDSANGTFVNGHRASEQSLHLGDVIRIGSNRLAFDGVTLRAYDDGASVMLTAEDLCQDVGQTRILSHVSFTALPGQVTAIAGASGSGKSTLLEALNGVRPASRGAVLINETELYANADSLRSLIGYVPQSEILHRELPLGRALTYSARLRLPQDTSADEIRERVESTLSELELMDRRDLPIRVLSGGQQKRASISVELLTRPGLFFLDEPTSGLDPGLAAKFMELLLRLAAEGRTIVLVSHDPEALAMCHQLVFLAPGGSPAYVGPATEALAHFGVASFAAIYAKVESDWTGRSPGEASRSSTSTPRNSSSGLDSVAPLRALQRATGPSHLHQLRVLTARYAEIMARDTRNLAVLVLQAPIIGAFLLLVSNSHSLTRGKDPKSDATKVLLLLAISAIWLGTINSSREIVKELPIYRRERMAGVGVAPYVLSKLLVLGALCMVQAFLLIATLAVKVELPSSGPILPGPIEMYVTLCLAAIAAMVMGLALSAATTTQERAVGLVPLVLVPQVIFAGVIFSLSGASRALSWLCVSKWTVQLLGVTARLPGSEYRFEGGFLVARWGTLGAMTFAFGTVAFWLLQRRE